MASSLGLTTFSQNPELPSPSVSAGLPSDFSEQGLHLVFKQDMFYLHWDAEFERIGYPTRFNAEVGPGYSDSVCINWEREMARARRACQTGDANRIAKELEAVRRLFAEYRASVQNIKLGLEAYLGAVKDSKVPRAKLSATDQKRYQLTLRLLPSLDRRFRDLHTIASGILRNNMKSLISVCCAAIYKASAYVQILTRQGYYFGPGGTAR